ncbi:hypothetical protein KC331_g22628, partial [Hortaea werneckii]
RSVRRLRGIPPSKRAPPSFELLSLLDNIILRNTAKLSTHRASRVPERPPNRQSKVSPHYFSKNKTSSHESSSPMSIENLKSFDPFAEAEDNQPDTKKGAQDYIHIRIQQRNGRKTLTTVQG